MHSALQLLSALVTLALAMADTLSNAGTEFVIAFDQGVVDRSPQSPLLYVVTTEDHPVQFTISDGRTTITKTVEPTTEMEIDVADTFGNLDSSLLISSTDGSSELIVMGLLRFHSGLSGDTFTAFPTHHYASYTYFAVSTPTSDGVHPGFIGLVGTEDDTEITITPTVNLSGDLGCNANATCLSSLQKLESQYLQSDFDLTGTKITSNKPLTVLSGHECAPIPDSVGNCEFLIEQIRPVRTWGKTFLVGPLPKRNPAEIYKIVSSEGDTSVEIYCNSNEHKTVELAVEGDFCVFRAATDRKCSFRASKPVLVMLFAPNDAIESDGAFMSIVPPINQYVNSVSFTMLNVDGKADTDKSVTLTVPVSSCPATDCSVIINDSDTIDITEPIYCSLNEVCGYTVSTNLSAGVHSLRMVRPGATMGVLLSAVHNGTSGYGTVGGMALDQIVVIDPNVDISISHEGPLLAGETIELSCSITIPGYLVKGTQTSARLLKGDERELKVTNTQQNTYQLKHVFEPLSLEDSGIYKCEATIRSQGAEVLATASQSLDITVLDYHYIQLLVVGVGKCSELLVGDTERTAGHLRDEVVRIVNNSCNCGFSSEFITMPTLKCNSELPDKLLFRARVQEGGQSPVRYEDVIASLQAAKTGKFRFNAILVTIDPDNMCSVEIGGITDPTDCFKGVNAPSDTGGVTNSQSSDNTKLIVAAVIPSSVAVVLCVLLMGMMLSRHSKVSNQRPKSIHLHHRMASGGESVTSFCPDSGSNSSNIYVEKQSNFSSPTTSPIHQNGGVQVPLTQVTDQEHGENYEIMKTDLSKIEIPCSDV